MLIRHAVFALSMVSAVALAQPLAITNVTVIDVAGGAPQAGVTVVISGERIAAVGKVERPANAQVVDGAGKFVIPGLWDMHGHSNDAGYMALFTANGVTGVRVMWGLPEHLERRKRIEEGSLPGPRMVLAGPLVDGPRPYWKDSTVAATPEQGRRAVQLTREGGYDFVKVYDSLPREAFFAMADEARKLGLPIVGHTPVAVGVAAASDAGLKSVEHLTGMLLAVSSREAEVRRDFGAALRLPPGAERDAELRRVGVRMLESHDAGKAAALYARLKANGTWQVPTFTVLRFNAYQREPHHEADDRLRYMPRWVRTLWTSDSRYRDVPADELEQRKRLFQRRLDLVGEMHRAGVGILAGSDEINPWCFPGFGLHDELEWLVKAGLSPLAALQAATRGPALYLGRSDLGGVEPGKLADLVLLDADPTQDIRNTRRIAAVVAAGKLHSRADLDRMLADVERRAGAN